MRLTGAAGSVARTVIWLLLAAMPFHALTGIYLDLRGPAHFHLHSHDDDDHDHHGHDQVEHHHHAVSDPDVVTVADDAHPPDEGPGPGWSATMCVALVSAATSLQLPAAASGVVPGQAPFPQTRFPGCLERPPRLLSA